MHVRKKTARNTAADGHSITMVGLGNIGSPLATLVARIKGVQQVTLVDFDSYEEKNLSCCGGIATTDVGKPKVQVQARRVKRVNSSLDVREICARVENVPLGLLRADAILAGLDSRIARQCVNQAAWRLGVPWIDAAVDASGLLVRVNVYVPGPENCCCECAWDGSDYSASVLEQPYPCKEDNGPAATNAPASLGTVTAGIMATELQKLLAGDWEHLLSGRQVMIDLCNHTHYVTTFPKNQRCRFDHQTWLIERLDRPLSRITLGQALRLSPSGSRDDSDCVLQLEGHSFVRMQFCPKCGNHSQSKLYLADRIPPARQICGVCKETMVVRGFDMVEGLQGSGLTRSDRRRSLSSLGFRPGDVLTVCSPAAKRHYELVGHPPGPKANRPPKRPRAVVSEQTR